MTAQEIIKALRCVNTPVFGRRPECKSCPYCMEKEPDFEAAKSQLLVIIGHCDIERIGMDAADMLEQLTEGESDG